MLHTTSTTSTTGFQSSSFAVATLPSLDKSVNTAPELARKVNRPVCTQKAADAWRRLQRIEHIDVVPVDGAASIGDTAYTVCIFFRHSQNRIPTNVSVGESSSLLGAKHGLSDSLQGSVDNMAPDIEVAHTYAELDALKHSARKVARQYHPVYCELCDSLAVKLVTKYSQSPLVAAMMHRSRATRAKKMRLFMVHLLGQLREKRAQCVPVCKGQNELPILLHDFLFGDEDGDSVTRL